jgi:hypothetical protein
MIKKAVRKYKGATIEFCPISESDAGIVRNGPSKLWTRVTGVIGGCDWVPCEGETPRVLNAARKRVLKSNALLAARRA